MNSSFHIYDNNIFGNFTIYAVCHSKYGFKVLDTESITATLVNIDTDDESWSLIFVPNENLILKRIKYMVNSITQVSITNRIDNIPSGSKIEIFNVDFAVSNGRGVIRQDLFVPQFEDDTLTHCISNFVFLYKHKKEFDEKRIMSELDTVLFNLNLDYNKAFYNDSISAKHLEGIESEKKILSNQSFVDKEEQFVFDGKYLADNLTSIVRGENENTISVDVTFKKRNASQIEAIVKFNDIVPEQYGGYSLLIKDKNTNELVDNRWIYIGDFSESDWLTILQSKKEMEYMDTLPQEELVEFYPQWSSGRTSFKESYYYNIFTNKQIISLSQYINSVTNVETRKRIY